MFLQKHSGDKKLCDLAMFETSSFDIKKKDVKDKGLGSLVERTKSIFDLEKEVEGMILPIWFSSYLAILILFLFASSYYSHLTIPNDREVSNYLFLELLYRCSYTLFHTIKLVFTPLLCGCVCFLASRLFFPSKRWLIFVSFGVLYFMSIYEFLVFFDKCGVLDEAKETMMQNVSLYVAIFKCFPPLIGEFVNRFFDLANAVGIAIRSTFS